MVNKIGLYLYFYPTLRQGRKALWSNIDRDEMPYLDHFPTELIDGKPNETEMSVKFINGSRFQVIGTDSLDAAIGSNPIGCVFSEYSLQNPQAWNLMRPILRENGGWALFNYTPRGKNHGWDLSEMAKRESDWFHQVLTIKDTRREDGTPVVTNEDVEKDIREGMSRDLAEQEYYCSFEGYQEGSILGELMRAAREQGRICRVPYEPKLPVITAWDIGIDDSTSIWWLQVAPGGEIRAIDYHEDRGKGLDHYSTVIKGRGWPYDYHCMPHDIEVRE
jgi:phage terminase large subunit